MTNYTHSPIGRRSVLKGAGITLAGLGGLASPVAAAKGKRESLLDGPAEFRLYWSDNTTESDDPNTPGDFSYPASPFLLSEDPDDTPAGDQGGLFDGSEIEKTPNGRTLHHTLQFFQGFLMAENRGKPYVLVNQGRVPKTPLYRFEARGQHLNFSTLDADTLAQLVGPLAYVDPLGRLVDGSWRAVGSEVVYVLAGDDGKPGLAAPFSATRVDFYDRSHGKPDYELSLLYLIYPNDGPANPQQPTPQPIPGILEATGVELIRGGRRNLGGQ